MWYASELAWETSGTWASPRGEDFLGVPAFVFGQLSGNVDVLELLQEILIVHPEDTIMLIVALLANRIDGFLGPSILVVISPVAIPFACLNSFTVGVP